MQRERGGSFLLAARLIPASLVALTACGGGGGAPRTDAGGIAGSERPDGTTAADAPADAAPGEVGSDALAPDPQLIEHVFAPNWTDTGIDRWADDHYAYLHRTVPRAGKLLVHLNHFGGAFRGRRFLREAAHRGYHVLGLRWPNAFGIRELCSTSADPDCTEKVRLEIQDGQDRDPMVVVTPANSLLNRLAKAVKYIADGFPSEGWGAYVDAMGSPRWGEIVLTGHGGGAGQAAFIARDRAVHRVVMISGPDDGKGTDPAAWVKAAHMTPAASYFGLSHTREGNHTANLAAWAALGLSGTPADVDAAMPPYGGSHELTTGVLPASRQWDDAQASTADDELTPVLADGSPQLAPVWRYLTGP